MAAQEHEIVYHCHITSVASIGLAIFRDKDCVEALSIPRLYHQNQTIKLVREMISDTAAIPSDSLLMAVLNLVVQGGTVDDRILPECHPVSPLATAQNLHAYRRMTLVPEHTRAMHFLIKKKGCLNKIHIWGLAILLAT